MNTYAERPIRIGPIQRTPGRCRDCDRRGLKRDATHRITMYRDGRPAMVWGACSEHRATESA